VHRTTRGRLEGLRYIAVDHRHRGAGVVEKVFDALGLEFRVDHDHDRANLQGAKQRPDERRAVRQRDQHPLLGLCPCLAQEVAEAVRQNLHLAIAQPSLIGD
jgi:hypothetical protein